MDAKILPGPGSRSPAGGRPCQRRPPQHPVGRPGAAAFGNHRRGRRRDDANRPRKPHRPQHLHLPPSAGDADQARLCRQGAGPPALRAWRAHSQPQPRLSAGRPAAARAALIWRASTGDRRDRASRRRCRATPSSCWRCARRATPYVSTPARPASVDAPHATSGRQGDAGLAAGGRNAAHSVAHGMKRFTDKTITEFPGADSVAARRAPQRLRHRPRGIPARRDLRRRCDPRPGRHRDRRHQRLDAGHARDRGSRRADARRDRRRDARARPQNSAIPACMPRPADERQ